MVDDSAWRLRKAKGLVKLLALAPGHDLHREQVLDLLWPDLSPDEAAHNLYQTLYVARRALGSKTNRGEWLALRNEVVNLAPPESLWIDVDAFEVAAEQAGAHKDTATYRAALDLYDGDLLPEDRYDDQINRRREALCAEYYALLLALAALHETQQQYEQAREALERVIASDPAHEEAHRALMRVLALSGHRQQALRQYQLLREALQRELEAQPDPDSERLYDEILHNQLKPVALRCAGLLRAHGARPRPDESPLGRTRRTPCAG